ncbi:hypothetical protein D3C76_1182450 [compost metagenome]
MPALYPQRAPRVAATGDHDFAAGQGNQALPGAEIQVGGAVGIELDPRAVRQLEASSFTRDRGEIGIPRLPAQVLAQPCRAACQGDARQQFHGLAPAEALGTVFQGVQGDMGTGHCPQVGGQFAVQRLHPLPGQFVFRVGGAPGVALLAQGRVSGVIAQA